MSYKLNKGLWVPKSYAKLYISGSDGSGRTNNNVPLSAGKVLYISKSQVPIYQKLNDEDEDYWRDRNIVKYIIVSDEDYMTIMRKKSENDYIDYSILDRETFKEKHGYYQNEFDQQIKN